MPEAEQSKTPIKEKKLYPEDFKKGDKVYFYEPRGSKRIDFDVYWGIYTGLSDGVYLLLQLNGVSSSEYYISSEQCALTEEAVHRKIRTKRQKYFDETRQKLLSSRKDFDIVSKQVEKLQKRLSEKLDGDELAQAPPLTIGETVFFPLTDITDGYSFFTGKIKHLNTTFNLVEVSTNSILGDRTLYLNDCFTVKRLLIEYCIENLEEKKEEIYKNIIHYQMSMNETIKILEEPICNE